MNLMKYTKHEIHSEKYDLDGVITDFRFSLDLTFQYDSKTVSMAIDRPFPFSEETLKVYGQQVMETYIEKLFPGKIKGRRLMLHHWYVQKISQEDDTYLVGQGIVTGHDCLADATSIHTSEIKNIELDVEAEELILHTRNSVYYCPLLYCNFHKQDKEAELLPDYEKIKEKYQGKLNYPSIEPGKVLLVLSSFDEYYFNSLYYHPKGEKRPLEYAGCPHIGTFQDSYLIKTDNYRIDLRYFPHYQNIKFYAEDTDGRPWFIENIGDIALYAQTRCGLIRLESGERKEVKRENVEKEKLLLPGGDLYPMVVI